MKSLRNLITFSCLVAILLGCTDEVSAPFNQQAYSTKYLYVATGACYGGGVATATGPANMISRYDLKTGVRLGDVIDYNTFSPGDSPIAMWPYSDEQILVLVENASGRRIDRVFKDGSGAMVHITNSTALSAAMRSLVMLNDFSILVSKSSAVEKFNAAKARVLIGANPWINAPAGGCATSTTLISSLAVFPNGKILYAHAAATPNNKLGLIAANGYSVAGDCLSSQAAPNTTALPTKALIHSSGQTLVSYGSTTATSNLVYSYHLNSGTNSFGTPVAAWTDFSTVNGPSTMVEDPGTGDVMIANATSTFNTVERFSFDPATGLLHRVGSAPFMSPTIYTRCISDMKVMP